MWINLTVGECFRTLQGLQVEIRFISTDTVRWLTAGALAARMRAAHVCIFRCLGYRRSSLQLRICSCPKFNKEAHEPKLLGFRYCSELLERETLSPQLHIWGFVIFMRLTGGWRSFVLTGLQRPNTFAFPVLLFPSLHHLNEFIYRWRSL